MKKFISILLSVLMLASITAGLDLTAFADDNYNYSLSEYSFTYDGEVKTPDVIVTDLSGNIIPPENYTVAYSAGRENVGEYFAEINLFGAYSGTETLKFKINPIGTSVSKLTSDKKSVTVKIKKVTKQITGYQIQYSTSAKLKKAKSISVSNKAAEKTINKLKSGKKYYIRVRTYKKVGEVKYYSSWSKTKSISTKIDFSAKIKGLKKKYPEGTKWGDEKFYNHGYGCAAFTAVCYKYVYGHDYTKIIYSPKFSQIKKGDQLNYESEYGTHWVFVISKGKNQITVAEGNYVKNGKPIVHYGRVIKKSELKGNTISVYR